MPLRLHLALTQKGSRLFVVVVAKHDLPLLDTKWTHEELCLGCIEKSKYNFERRQYFMVFFNCLCCPHFQNDEV